MTDLKQAMLQAVDALNCVCNDERTCHVLHHGRAESHAVGASCPAVKRLWVARHNLSEALAAPQPEPFDLNEASSKERFSAVNQAIRLGMLDAIDEIDAEIECVEMEYVYAKDLKLKIVNALERAKQLIRDRMAHGIGGDK